MAWEKDAAARQRDNAVYGDPEYRKNRKIAWQRAGGRCELLIGGRRCGSKVGCQVDHIKNVAGGVNHHLDNLHVLCGQHHAEKTARESRAGRRRKVGDPPLQARTNW